MTFHLAPSKFYFALYFSAWLYTCNTFYSFEVFHYSNQGSKNSGCIAVQIIKPPNLWFVTFNYSSKNWLDFSYLSSSLIKCLCTLLCLCRSDLGGRLHQISKWWREQHHPPREAGPERRHDSAPLPLFHQLITQHIPHRYTHTRHK